MSGSTGAFRRGLRRTLVGLVVVAAASLAFAGTVGAGTTSTTAPAAPAVVADPIGPFGYTNGAVFGGGGPTCRFYKVGLGNGVAEQLGSGLPCADGYTFDGSGVLFAYTTPAATGAPIVTSKLVTVNLANGTQTIVGDMGHAFFDGGMTFDKDGNLWLYADVNDAACTAASCLYSVNPTTGATTFVGHAATNFLATGLAANCSTVYATGAALNQGTFSSDALYVLDTATAAVTKVGTGLQLTIFTSGLDFASDGTLYTLGEPALHGPALNAPKTATVDTATGVAGNVHTWTSEDLVPGTVAGLAVAGISCPAPPGPPVTPPAAVQPTFTG
jgi:hypothetical protein